MTLRQLLELRKGSHNLKLFRSVESGGLFTAVDKVVGTRTIRGPFLSESDIRCLVDIVYRHKNIRARHWRARARALVDVETLPARQTSYEIQGAQLEIEEAIRKVKEKVSAITVIPSLPKYAYVYTCSICGSHVESHLRLAPGSALKLCANCGYVHAATE